jgi:excisionase family DNA binding protein
MPGTGTAAATGPYPTETAEPVSRNTCFDQLPENLTPQELATFLGWSTWTVYKAIHAGEIPHRRIGKKCIFIPKSFLNPNRATQQVTS